jgi:hypothetical protein
MYKLNIAAIISLLPLTLQAADLEQFYCPHGSAIIRIGMSKEQVRSTCGEPQSHDTNTSRVVQNVSVTRLTYNNINKGSVYYWNVNKVYDMFSLPSGNLITPLTVIIANGKVKSINLNGNEIQSTTACSYSGSVNFPGGTDPSTPQTLSVGDPEQKVYSTCGGPDFTDHTYSPQPVESSDKPERWIYKLDDFHPGYQLIFIRGLLVSIQSM